MPVRGAWSVERGEAVVGCCYQLVAENSAVLIILTRYSAVVEVEWLSWSLVLSLAVVEATALVVVVDTLADRDELLGVFAWNLVVRVILR